MPDIRFFQGKIKTIGNIVGLNYLTIFTSGHNVEDWDDLCSGIYWSRLSCSYRNRWLKAGLRKVPPLLLREGGGWGDMRCSEAGHIF